MDDGTLNFLCDQIGKSIENPEMLKLGPAKLKKLRNALEPDRAKLKYLTKRGASISRKRKIARQSGQGLGILVGILAPILINVVRNLVAKGKKK